MMSLSEKPTSTGNYNFFTQQYQLCNIDFSVISIQNRRSKRIVIPRRECNSTSYTVPKFVYAVPKQAENNAVLIYFH